MHLVKKLTAPALLFLAFTLTVATMADEDVLGIPIGARRVTLDFNEVSATGNIDAFIPTGSDSDVCLATFGESNGYGAGPSPAICVPRIFQGQKGVLLVVIPYFAQFQSDLTLSLTVYQRGARRYGQRADRNVLLVGG